MSDNVQNKTRLHTFNAINNLKREILKIGISTGMPETIATGYLDQWATLHDYPEKVCVENGPNLTSVDFIECAKN